jgi:DNA-binding NtrC family response regulator
MNEKLRNVLLVEHSAPQREELAGRLRKELGCVVHAVGSPVEAAEILAGGEVCVLIIGLDLPLYQGLALHQFVLKHHSQVLVLPVVLLGNQREIAEVLRTGAFSYINSPYNSPKPSSSPPGLSIFTISSSTRKSGAPRSENLTDFMASSAIQRRCRRSTT